MRLFTLLLGSAAILSSCQDDVPVKFPLLEPGTYQLEILDENGKRVLQRNGTAIGLGSYNQIRMDDPDFGEQPENPHDAFAYVLLSTPLEQTWDDNKVWDMTTEGATGIINQHFYTIKGDWCYKSIEGRVKILESTAEHMKGSFSIKMQILQDQEEEPWFDWEENPKWGETITVRGYFNAKGW